MAINPSTLAQFIGRITSPTPEFPFGSSKDETTAGAADGTPYIRLRADDIFGMQQSFLSAAGITPSGNPDNALASQYLDAIVGLNWYQYANYKAESVAIRNGRKFIALAANGPLTANVTDPISPDNGVWVPLLAESQNLIPFNAKITPRLLVDATPRAFSPGEEVSLGWIVGTAFTDLTYIDGKYNAASGGTLYRDVPQEDGLQFYTAAELIASTADKNRVPKNAGVDISDVAAPGFIRVTIDFATASDVFSAKLEVGAFSTKHDVGEAGGAGGGATGGGNDQVFYENGTNVTADYTITAGKNAMSAGPITIDSGVTVEVPVGSVWTVV